MWLTFKEIFLNVCRRLCGMQVLSAERRGRHVLLLVGESATPPVDHRPGPAAPPPPPRRPSSFQPALRRCVAAADADDTAGEMAADARWSERTGASRRTWRHAPSSAAGRHLAAAAAAAATGTVWWTIITAR